MQRAPYIKRIYVQLGFIETAFTINDLEGAIHQTCLCAFWYSSHSFYYA